MNSSTQTFLNIGSVIFVLVVLNITGYLNAIIFYAALLAIVGFGIYKIFGKRKSSEIDSMVKHWWTVGVDKPTSQGQQFVLFTLVLLIAYIEFHLHTGALWATFAILLLAAIYSPPKSKVAKAFILFDLIVIILASFFTGVQQMRKTSFEIADTAFSNGAQNMQKFSNDYKAGKVDFFSFFARNSTTKQTTPQLVAPQTPQPVLGQPIYLIATNRDMVGVNVTGYKYSTHCDSGTTMFVYYKGISEPEPFNCASNYVEIGDGVIYVGFTANGNYVTHPSVILGL